MLSRTLILALCLAVTVAACGGRVETSGSSLGEPNSGADPQPASSSDCAARDRAVVVATSLNFPVDLALAGQDIYLSTHHAVLKVPGDCGPIETIAYSDVGYPGIIVSGTGAVAWSMDTTLIPGAYEPDIDRVLLFETSGGSTQAFARGVMSVDGLALDSASLYVAIAFEMFGPGRVVQVDRATGKSTVLAPDSSARGIAVDDDTVVWCAEQQVMRLLKAGGQPQPLLPPSPNGYNPTSVRLANDTVYVRSDNRVLRLDPDKGTPVAILSTDETIGDFEVNAGFVYWLEVPAQTDDNSYPLGRLRRTSSAGGSPETLLDGLRYPVAIELDSDSVFVLERGGVKNDLYQRDGAVHRIPR